MKTLVEPASLAGGHCRLRKLNVSPCSQLRTDFELWLTEDGATTLLFGGRETLLPPRRLALLWRGIPHQVLAHEAREAWSLRLPLEWVLARRLPAALLHVLLEGRVVFEPDIDQFECDWHRLRLWSQGGGRRHPLEQRALALEVEARLLRLAASLPTRAATVPRERAMAIPPRRKVLEIAGLIAERHAGPLSMSELGRAAGLHPNYVMNLFRRELGTSTLEYLTQHRVAHALRLFVTTREGLPAILRRSGFGSDRRFRVAFRGAFREAPAAFRRRLLRAGRILSETA